MSPVQIVTLVVVCAVVLSCLLIFLMDLWKMRKALDRMQPAEQKTRAIEPRPPRRGERSQRSQISREEKNKGRLRVIK